MVNVHIFDTTMSKHIPESLRNAKSPFTEHLVIPVVARNVSEDLVSASKIKHDKDTGITTNTGPTHKINKGYVIEKDKKICLYFDNDGEDLRPAYSSLTKEGRMLLEYILFYCLRENKLICYIDSQDFMTKYFVKSRTTVSACKRSLIDNGFVSPTSLQGWFWINPKYMYRGYRSRTQELDQCLKFKNNEE